MEAITAIAILGMVLWSLRIQVPAIPKGAGARSGVKDDSQDWEGPDNVEQMALTLARWGKTSAAFHRIP